jgi:hypothetical protein
LSVPVAGAGDRQNELLFVVRVFVIVVSLLLMMITMRVTHCDGDAST